MDIHQELQRLLSLKSMHKLYSPLSEEDYLKAVSELGIELPSDLKTVLKAFDGAELFKPGITFYGLTSKPMLSSINDVNIKMQDLYSIPKNYIIFGRLNFGDLLCINLKNEHDIIEWDHETDTEVCSWDNLSELIHEEIQNFNDHFMEDSNEN